MNERGFIIVAILEHEETMVEFLLPSKPYIINLHNQVGVRYLIAQVKS